MAKVGDKLPLGVVAQVIAFKSKSNPANSYETIVYEDGNLSCNCPGWTRRTPKGIRECKHTHIVDQMRSMDPCNTTGAVVHSITVKGKAPVPTAGRRFNFT
jgi:hypothetical protein